MESKITITWGMIGAVILVVCGLVESNDGNSISAAIFVSSAWLVLVLDKIASRMKAKG